MYKHTRLHVPGMSTQVRTFCVYILVLFALAVVMQHTKVDGQTGKVTETQETTSDDISRRTIPNNRTRSRTKRSPILGSHTHLLSKVDRPTFDPAVPRNVTTQLGQTVYLHCRVHSLGDKTVSWIRRRDFHVLTVGLVTYTADDRFVAVNMERSDDWMLQIKLAQLADEGLYECQVNTHPLISFFVHLTVLVPKSSIREAPDLYVKTGSSINLTCVISQSPEPPVFVFWYHNDRMINYDSSSGEITVHKAGEDTAISRLFIRNAQPQDSGNYTCGPSNADASSISVHVLNGEKRAAMQHDLNPSPKSSTASTLHLDRTCQFLAAILVLLSSTPVMSS